MTEFYYGTSRSGLKTRSGPGYHYSPDMLSDISGSNRPFYPLCPAMPPHRKNCYLRSISQPIHRLMSAEKPQKSIWPQVAGFLVVIVFLLFLIRMISGNLAGGMNPGNKEAVISPGEIVFLVILFGITVIMGIWLLNNARQKDQMKDVITYIRAFFVLCLLILIVVGSAYGLKSMDLPPDLDKGTGGSVMFTMVTLFVTGGIGGLLYALSNQKLTLPHVTNENEINLGFVSDMLFGMAGAFVIFLVLPGDFLVEDTTTLIKFLGIALAGGYGGRSIVDRYLASLLKKQEERLKEMETTISDQGKQVKLDAEILTKVNEYLEMDEQAAAEAVDKEKLKGEIKKASAPALVQVFSKARETRKANWKKNKPLSSRTIPIFEALCDTDKEEKFHRYQGQLGYALKDQKSPDYTRAIQHLTKAIEIRDKGDDKDYVGYLYYEMNRAIARIGLHFKEKGDHITKDPLKEKIAADLNKAALNPDILVITQKDETLKAWLDANAVTLLESAAG